MGLSGTIVVLDVGKTLGKLSRWSTSGDLLEKMVRPNVPQSADAYTALDTDGIGQWATETLRSFATHGPVDTIITVGHGAGIVGLRKDALAFPPIDYEQPIPSEIAAAYRKMRAPFAETGSPSLPDGLNFGSQLHWLEALDPAILDGVTLLPWAQYWSWWLSGVARSEVTSLGCHSDLWNPGAGDFSALAKGKGWASKFAPMAKAADSIGTLRPALAAATGLSENVKIHCGIHDSNAALIAARGFPQIAANESTILSTGTWFVAMRSPQSPVDLTALPEAQDCLVNVDADGVPVPSARFMGGREIETLVENDRDRVDLKADQPALLTAVRDALASRAMLLPGFAPGFGPYPAHQGRWINRPEDEFARRAAICLYAAMVAQTSLSLIGTQGALLVEGRFAEAEVFVRALASLRPDLSVFTANAHNDVSFGALRLIDSALRPHGDLTRVQPLDADLTDYHTIWKTKLEGKA